MNFYSDEQLIIDYKNGDKRAFEILVKRYLEIIDRFVSWRISNESEVENITQEIFIKVWKNLKRFDERKSFKIWLLIIAKNATIDFLRKKQTIPFTALEKENDEYSFAETIIDPTSLPLERLELTDHHQALSDAIKRLSPIQQKIISLHFNNQLTFREIGLVLNQSLNTVKSRCRRAISTLQKLL